MIGKHQSSARKHHSCSQTSTSKELRELSKLEKYCSRNLFPDSNVKIIGIHGDMGEEKNELSSSLSVVLNKNGKVLTIKLCIFFFLIVRCLSLKKKL